MTRKTEEPFQTQTIYLNDDNPDDVRLTAWAEMPGLPGWMVWFVIRRRRGVSEMIELHVEPATSALHSGMREGEQLTDPELEGGVTTTALRSLAVGALSAAAAAEAGDAWIPAIDGPDEGAWRGWADGFVATPRPGRAGRDPVEYARLAARYVALVNDPTVRKPLVALAAEAAKRHEYQSVSRLRGLLNEARHRGLLTAAPPGRAGGSLTPEAIKLLKETDDGSR
jgi:hypothetical protein